MASRDDNATRPTAVDPAAFVDAVEHPTRRSDAKTLLALMRDVTGEEPRMWGPTIVGFGSYHYRYAYLNKLADVDERVLRALVETAWEHSGDGPC